MKLLAPVKHVVDFNVKVRIKPDGSGVELCNVKMSMNPFDEIAVEEAVRLKEAGKADEIVAVPIGPHQVRETLRTALAMGADRAILVKTDAPTEPLGVAKVMKGVVEAEKPDLVILGKQAIDDDANQTGQMLAALLGWAQVTFACRLEIANGMGMSPVRSMAASRLSRRSSPVIVTTDLRLNQPHYASLPNIMKAKNKSLDEKTPPDYGADITPRLKVLKTEEATARRAGMKVKTVGERQRIIELGILLVAEHDNASLSGVTAKALSAALKIGSEVDIIVASNNARPAAEAAAKLEGVRKVRLAEADERAFGLAEPLAATVVSLAGSYDTLVAPSTDAAGGSTTRCHADLRNHRDRVARHVQARHLHRLRDPDRPVDRRQEGDHSPHGIFLVRARWRTGSNRYCQHSAQPWHLDFHRKPCLKNRPPRARLGQGHHRRRPRARVPGDV
jgi:electron transfer flavoprotein beta subunit